MTVVVGSAYTSYDNGFTYRFDSTYAGTGDLSIVPSIATTYYADGDVFGCDAATTDHLIMPMVVSGIEFYAPISMQASMTTHIYQFSVGQAHHGRTAAWRRRLKKQKRRIAKANAKAIVLLQAVIGPKEFRRFKYRGYIEVVGSSGVRYRLKPSHKIDVMSPTDNKVVERLCLIHADLNMPPVDTLIAQLLLIKSGREGETKLREIGIRHAA